jgi:hypothetical protein
LNGVAGALLKLTEQVAVSNAQQEKHSAEIARLAESVSKKREISLECDVIRDSSNRMKKLIIKSV